MTRQSDRGQPSRHVVAVAAAASQAQDQAVCLSSPRGKVIATAMKLAPNHSAPLFCWILLCFPTGILSVAVVSSSYGSPEQPAENGSFYSSSTFIYVQRTVRRQAEGGGLCVLPEPLQNGRYTPSRNRCPSGDSSPACRMVPGAFVPYNWVINFNCDSGYKLNTSQPVAVCVNGKWLPGLAACEEIPTLKPCAKSETVVNTNNELLSPCKGDVVFEDTFDGPQLSDKWKHVVTIGDTPDDLFNVFRSDPSNSLINRGKLVIRPVVFDDADVTSGSLDLQGCTAPRESQQWLCKRKGFPFSILPPVASTRIHTRDSFSFRYGQVEVRAKMPQGDWLVPELWLEPKDQFYGPGLLSGRVRIAMTRGNSDLRCEGEDLGMSQLESAVLLGPEGNVRKRSVRTRLPDNWHREFHNYTFIWRPGSISFKIDDESERELVFEGGRLCGAHDIAHIADEECSPWRLGSSIAPLDKDFYISFGLVTGNERDFPDDCLNRGRPKPWKNLELMAKLQFWQDRDHWRPTWTDDGSSLYIEHVRVTAL